MAFLGRPDGCRLYYEVHGPEGTSPIALLEGMGGDISGWRRNIPHLAAHHRVVAVDSRGNGRSDKPDRPVSMGTFVDDTSALLDHMGVESAHLYGQSFGAMVAMELALTHPERVRSLELAATHAGAGRSSRGGWMAHVPKDKPHLALYSEAFAREHPEHVAEDMRVGGRNPQPPHARRRQWDAIQAWDAWDRVSDLQVPTLILHGTEDRLIDVGNARRLAALIPGSKLVLLEGAGHVYHSEQPEASDAAVIAFVGEVDEGR
jgi:3-oxoadipate enol-lactonase